MRRSWPIVLALLTSCLARSAQPGPPEPPSLCLEAWRSQPQVERHGAVLRLVMRRESSCAPTQVQDEDVAVLAPVGGTGCTPGRDWLRWSRSGLSTDLAAGTRLPPEHLAAVSRVLQSLLPGPEGFEQGAAVSAWCDASSVAWLYVLFDDARQQVGLVAPGRHAAHVGALPMVGQPLALLRGTSPPAAAPEPPSTPSTPSLSPLERELELAWEQQQREAESVRDPAFLASCGSGDAGVPRAPTGSTWESRSIGTGSLSGPSHLVERTIELSGDKAMLRLVFSQERPEASTQQTRPSGPYEVTRQLEYEGTVQRCGGGLQFALRNTCLPSQQLYFACLAKTLTVAAPNAVARHVTNADDAEGCSGSRWNTASRLRVPGYECYYQVGSPEVEASFVAGAPGLVEHVTLSNDCGGWRLLRKGSRPTAPVYRRPTR